MNRILVFLLLALAPYGVYAQPSPGNQTTVQGISGGYPVNVQGTGSAGSPATSVSTVQGISGGTPIQVIGQDTQVSTTPTVTASAYAASNCVGGFNAVALARVNGGNGLVQNVIVASKTGLTPTLTVYLFNANPTSSTCTDKGTFTLNAADQNKLIAQPFALTLVVPQGSTPSFGELASMARPFTTGGATTNIYFALVSGGVFTPASTSEFTVTIGADLN